ncbi:MAG: twin-arginine translocation signal domain-containing protein [Chitinophagaceae bacterium]|nr:twin-arginine translocation signal domain-containing protein [Chitinophagaceae bacterium]
MKDKTQEPVSARREFLGAVAAGAAALGLASLPIGAQAKELLTGNTVADENNPEEWFKQIKGKHRMVFDATQPHELFPFAWPKVFLMTNEVTGTAPKDCSVVVVLRHTALGYAMEDKLWEKYKLGEIFKANDPKTGKPATRNPFWQPKADDFVIPGIGAVPLGINDLQKEGVMFCYCQAAFTVYSTVAAKMMNMDVEALRKEWQAGILPGIQPVPSGVWALGRAQEHGCGYIFAG